MNKVKHLFPGVLALLAVLLLTGCGEKENPTRTSLELDTSTLTLLIGESAFRTATTKAEHSKITYTSSNPTVATVDRMGKVTGMSAGQAVITVEMAESIVDWYAPKKLTYNVVVKKAGSDDDGGATPDLSMVDNAGVARSTMSTANCYMVHTAGNYKLPLVYGNAIKDGADNTDAYKPGGTLSATYCTNFVNHAGTAINAPWITKATTGTGADKGMGIVVSTAELLWQDAQGLITAVGIDGDYLTLTVGKDATTQEGNAVIAAKSGDDIVWSWHIWVTKETFAAADLTTVNTSSHTYTVTPVNLGWVATTTDKKQGYAPYYQWGRKDPFKGTGAPADLTVYDINGTAIAGLTYTASTTATIADNIKNPTKHYYNSTNEGPCDTQYYNMWDAQQTGTGNITTATVKTVYDPCPAGFCVPTGNLYYFMGNGSTRPMTTWDGTNKGATWDNSVVANSITGTALFFPASGYRTIGSGSLSSVGSYGYCWSASPFSGNCGRRLCFYSGNWTWDGSDRASGFPVRAVAEE